MYENESKRVVEMLDVNSILPGERIRKSFNESNICNLLNGVSDITGLINPITVKDRGDGLYDLVAGETRLQSFKLGYARNPDSYISDLKSKKNLSDNGELIKKTLEKGFKFTPKFANKPVPSNTIPCIVLEKETSSFMTGIMEIDENNIRKGFSQDEAVEAERMRSELIMNLTKRVVNAAINAKTDSELQEVKGEMEVAFSQELLTAEQLTELVKSTTTSEDSSGKQTVTLPSRTEKRVIALSDNSNFILIEEILNILSREPEFTEIVTAVRNSKAENSFDTLKTLMRDYLKSFMAKQLSILQSKAKKTQYFHRVYNKDFMEMTDVFDGDKLEFDLIVVDPPYGIDANIGLNHGYIDTPENAVKIFRDLLSFSFKYLKDGAPIVVFYDMKMAQILTETYKRNFINNYEMLYFPLFFPKPSNNIYTIKGTKFRRNAEQAFVFFKGNIGEHTKMYEPLSLVNLNLWNFPTEKLDEAEKPYDVLAAILKAFTIEGDTVADFCAGSGSLMSAAVNLNRNSVSVEIDTTRANLITQRRESLVKRG